MRAVSPPASLSPQRHHATCAEQALLESLVQFIKGMPANESISLAIDDAARRLALDQPGWTAQKVRAWVQNRGIHWGPQIREALRLDDAVLGGGPRAGILREDRRGRRKAPAPPCLFIPPLPSAEEISKRMLTHAVDRNIVPFVYSKDGM